MTMHSGSPLIRIFGYVTWLVTSIGAINWGLEAMGYNIFGYPLFASSFPHLIMPTKYIIGFFGVVSLLMMLDMVLRGKHCNCGCGSSNCSSC